MSAAWPADIAHNNVQSPWINPRRNKDRFMANMENVGNPEIISPAYPKAMVA